MVKKTEVKDETKAAKLAFEKADSALRELIRQNPLQQTLPGMDGKAWKDAPFEALRNTEKSKVTERQIKALNDSSLLGLGELAALCIRPRTSAGGISKDSAHRVEDVLAAIRAEHEAPAPA